MSQFFRPSPTVILRLFSTYSGPACHGSQQFSGFCIKSIKYLVPGSFLVPSPAGVPSDLKQSENVTSTGCIDQLVSGITWQVMRVSCSWKSKLPFWNPETREISPKTSTVISKSSIKLQTKQQVYCHLSVHVCCVRHGKHGHIATTNPCTLGGTQL